MNAFPVVQTDNLWRVYRLGKQEIPALRGINLSVMAGQFIVLRGRSGSGKTTLMNCLAGLDRPTSGAVRILGKDLAAFDERSLTEWRRSQLGLVFQSFGLIPTLSAFENVELLLRLGGGHLAERRQRSLECLDLVGLGRWAHHRPYEMSGGQQQRVAVARALANRPHLVLADEPTGELDSSTGREILALFRQVVDQEGVTLLMVSHDPLVDEYADQVLHLVDGQIAKF
jgi:ABC-type lipoprotein export system ATPase subunit